MIIRKKNIKKMPVSRRKRKANKRQVIKISNTVDETLSIAEKMASKINTPVLIGLRGKLGTGKTCFAKGFARGLRINELVTSPTFLGISEYYSGKLPFAHMDFYKKVVSLQLINDFYKRGFVVLIEWVNNFEEVFKKKLKTDINVLIEYLKDDSGNLLIDKRQITICYTR